MKLGTLVVSDIDFALWKRIVIVFVGMGLLSLIFSLFIFSISSSKLYRYGYIDKSGKFVIAPRFKQAKEFSEGLAPVAEDAALSQRSHYQWGYVDTLGRIAIKPQFEEASPFHEGLAAAVTGNKLGYINRYGNFAIVPKFDANGFNGYGYANDANDFKEGRAVVYINKKCGLIDKNGTYIVKPNLVHIESFSEHLAVFARNEDLYGYMDLNGNTIIKPQFKNAGPFSEGLAKVQIGETDERDGDYRYKVRRWGYINKAGKIVLSAPHWTNVGSFHNGLASVELDAGCPDNFKGGCYQCIDKTGKFVGEPKFGYIGNFHDGLAREQIMRTIKYGYINKTGKIVIPDNFSDARDFHEGLAAVSSSPDLNAKIWGYINTTGSYVIDPQFVIPGRQLPEFAVFHEGLAIMILASSAYNKSRLDQLGLISGGLIFVSWACFCIWMSRQQRNKT